MKILKSNDLFKVASIILSLCFSLSLSANTDFKAYLDKGNGSKDIDIKITNYSKAIKNWDSSDTKKSLSDVYCSRGTVFEKAKEYDKALADFSKAMELAPDNMSAYMGRGDVYDAQLEYEKAMTDFNKAIVFNETDPYKYKDQAEAARNNKQYGRALVYLNKAISMDPKIAQFYSVRGGVYYDLQKFDQSMTDFDKSIELDPEVASVYMNRSSVYSAMHQEDKAYADVKKAVSLNGFTGKEKIRHVLAPDGTSRKPDAQFVPKITGWERDGLKGKVKQQNRLTYRLVERHGESKTNLRKTEICSFDEQGFKTEEFDGIMDFVYSYDPQGAVIKKTNAHTGLGIEETRWAFKCDSQGRPIEDTLTVKGILRRDVKTKYDNQGKIIEQTEVDSDGTLVGKHVYKYNDQGKILEDALSDSSGDLYTVACKYDGQGNLVERRWTDVNNHTYADKNFKTDAMGNVVEFSTFEIFPDSEGQEDVFQSVTRTTFEYYK